MLRGEERTVREKLLVSCEELGLDGKSRLLLYGDRRPPELLGLLVLFSMGQQLISSSRLRQAADEG